MIRPSSFWTYYDDYVAAVKNEERMGNPINTPVSETLPPEISKPVQTEPPKAFIPPEIPRWKAPEDRGSPGSLKATGISCGILAAAPVMNFSQTEDLFKEWCQRTFIYWGSIIYDFDDYATDWKKITVPQKLRVFTGCAIIFGDADGNKNGQWTADQIQKHNLGETIKVELGVNHNSGNPNTLFVWKQPDVTAIAEYCYPEFKGMSQREINEHVVAASKPVIDLYKQKFNYNDFFHHE